MPDFFSESKKNKRADELVPEYVNRTEASIKRLGSSLSGLNIFADKSEAPPAYKSNNEEIAAGFEKTLQGLHTLSEKVADLAVNPEEVTSKYER